MLDWLKDHAPRLAMAVGDTLTGGAVSRIADALGVDVDDADELKERLKADPALMRKLQRQEHELALQELRVRLEDRADARTMQERTRSWVPRVLAVATVVGYFACLGYVLHAGLSEASEAALILLGTLQGIVTSIFGFYFGTSESESTHNLQRP